MKNHQQQNNNRIINLKFLKEPFDICFSPVNIPFSQRSLTDEKKKENSIIMKSVFSSLERIAFYSVMSFTKIAFSKPFPLKQKLKVSGDAISFEKVKDSHQMKKY